MSTAALRLGRWFHGPDPEPEHAESLPEPLSARAQAQRKLYADIGDFLFVHGLDISDRNFAVVRAYLDGDREVATQIEEVFRAGGTLSEGAMAAIADRGRQALAPEKLGDMAGQLNDKLVECLHIIARSSTDARDYGAAIDQEAQGFGEDPLGTVERLLTLSREAVADTQSLEAQLGHARKETERLRSHLTRARREADHDHLTGLLNRRSFENRLASLPVTADPDVPRCVVLCDIDRFKVINDEHGHETGDRVLRYFARRLRDLLDDRAVVARYGGEEFVCLFEGMPIAAVTDAIEAIREAIEARPLVSRTSGRPMPPLTFSAGVAAISGDPRDALVVADQALYDAKHAGRNRVMTAGRTA